MAAKVFAGEKVFDSSTKSFCVRGKRFFSEHTAVITFLIDVLVLSPDFYKQSMGPPLFFERIFVLDASRRSPRFWVPDLKRGLDIL